MLSRLNSLRKLHGEVLMVSLEQIVQQKSHNNILESSNNILITSVSKIDKESLPFLKRVQELPNVRVIPSYLPLVEMQTQSPGLSLVIGDIDALVGAELDTSKVVTLQELSRLHPEEVPLSLRNRDTSYCESFLGKRLGKQLPEDKILKFDRILLLAESIKMWDEAIQIILDLQPVPLIVPYLQAKPAKVYRPSVEDFEMALCNIHKLVKSVVTTHADLHFVKWNQDNYLRWIESKVEAEGKIGKWTIDKSIRI